MSSDVCHFDPAAPPLLDVRSLSVRFPVGGGSLWRQSAWTTVVQDVSLTLRRGQSLGLVGESGSGKTTLARAILRLVPATSGEVFFEGQDVLRLPAKHVRSLRRHMQMVFQDPFGSLNPRHTIGRILAEPIRFHGIAQGAACEDRVALLLAKVGLARDYASRYPHEFSGGQRQRIGIARALATNPDLIICDEPVSALDVSVQAQILNLLKEIQADMGPAYLFISHDLAVVEHLCDEVAVMYRGRIVERGRTSGVFAEPRDAYTQSLLSSASESWCRSTNWTVGGVGPIRSS